ncbi:hypothetical protein EGI24_00085 [Lacihabitans sp. CS3-21]|nr:hypothetical protein [Lacihabitans sp. CS3-21]
MPCRKILTCENQEGLRPFFLFQNPTFSYNFSDFSLKKITDTKILKTLIFKNNLTCFGLGII